MNITLRNILIMSLLLILLGACAPAPQVADTPTEEVKTPAPSKTHTNLPPTLTYTVTPSNTPENTATQTPSETPTLTPTPTETQAAPGKPTEEPSPTPTVPDSGGG